MATSFNKDLKVLKGILENYSNKLEQTKKEVDIKEQEIKYYKQLVSELQETKSSNNIIYMLIWSYDNGEGAPTEEIQIISNKKSTCYKKLLDICKNEENSSDWYFDMHTVVGSKNNYLNEYDIIEFKFDFDISSYKECKVYSKTGEYYGEYYENINGISIDNKFCLNFKDDYKNCETKTLEIK